MTSATDRLGRRRDYAYDDAGRVETEKWYDNTPTLVRTHSFSYDAVGNVLTAEDPHGTHTFTYDELNRADVIKDVHGQTLTFTFDAVGNRTVVDDSQGGTTTSTYNAVNLLTKREFDDGTTELRFDQTYTSRLQLEEITRYSNLSGATKVGESDFTYDDNGRLENIQHKDGASTILTNYTYTYDLSSRIDTERIDGTTKTFTYDKTNQLTHDDSNTYSYDLNGNRDMTGYQTGTGNRMTNDGTYTYVYDDAGNTIKKSKGANDTTWVYEHDHRNQLISIEKQETDGGTVLLRVEYDYDVFGRRIREGQWESATGTVTTKFSYDGEDVWLDLDGSDALKMRFIRPDGIDQLAARIDAGDNVGWYHADVRQSIVLITDNSATTLNNISYDGFGNPTQTNESNGGRYLYTGREFNIDTLLQYNRDRYYYSASGSWTTPDRIGFRAGDPNLYRYVGNNPTNAIDPMGQYIVANSVTAAVRMVDKLKSLGYSATYHSLGPKSSRHYVKAIPTRNAAKAENQERGTFEHPVLLSATGGDYNLEVRAKGKDQMIVHWTEDTVERHPHLAPAGARALSAEELFVITWPNLGKAAGGVKDDALQRDKRLLPRDLFRPDPITGRGNCCYGCHIHFYKSIELCRMPADGSSGGSSPLDTVVGRAVVDISRELLPGVGVVDGTEQLNKVATVNKLIGVGLIASELPVVKWFKAGGKLVIKNAKRAAPYIRKGASKAKGLLGFGKKKVDDLAKQGRTGVKELPNGTRVAQNPGLGTKTEIPDGPTVGRTDITSGKPAGPPTLTSQVDSTPLRHNSKRPVRPGDEGTYGNLKNQKRRHGETERLDMDHQPSFAAQVEAREQALGRELTPEELKRLKNSTPAVASPRNVHQQTSPTFGGRNTKARIEADAEDLEKARIRDRNALDNAMKK